MDVTDTVALADLFSYDYVDGRLTFSDSISLSEVLTESQKWILDDLYGVSDSFASVKLVAFADAIAFTSLVESKLVFHTVSFSSSISFDDFYIKIVKEEVLDSFELTDSVSIGKVIAAVLDALGLNDSFLALSTVTKAFESTLAFDDNFNLRYRIEQADALSFVDDIFARIRQTLSWTDSLSFTDSNTYSFLIQLTLDDSLSFNDSFFNTIQRVLSLSDTFGLLGQFALEGDTYLVWAFNPKTGGAYKLKYPQKINSFARIGGKNLLCAADGIYEVAGTDDDGEAIDAFLKTGFEDFNDPERHYPGEKIKQLLNAYLVLSAEGETLLKIITTRRGEAIETWFKCREKPDVVSKAQISLSNSLRSVLFQFELRPLDGLPAKFRELEIIPLFLSRSI